MQSLCNDWEFTSCWSDPYARGEGKGTPVRLPHTVKEIPLHHADPDSYQMVCGYRRKLELEKALEGYAEPIPGARERVKKVLRIMLTAWLAARMRQEAEQMLSEL